MPFDPRSALQNLESDVHVTEARHDLRKRFSRSCPRWLIVATFISSLLTLASRAAQASPQVTVSANSSSSVWPIQPMGVSGRIAALKKHLASGDPHAVQQFWNSVRQSGTPLIDPLPRSDEQRDQVIATFLWRGGPHIRVAIAAPLTKEPRLPRVPLVHLAGTDVWYSAWRMKSNLRFSYRFSVELQSGQESTSVDPLNRRKVEVSFEGASAPPTEFSIASMPLAPPETWLGQHVDVPSGKVTVNILPSMSLGTDRKIWIYTPPGYDPRASDPYHLLILFDGYSYQHWIPAPTILDNLIHAHAVAPTVAVLIDNPPESRSSDLHVSPAFLRFLTSELMSWVRGHLNVTHDPTKTIIAGYSLGGLAAAFIAMQRPDLFGNVLSQSGSFWEGNANIQWEFLANRLRARARLPIHFFIEAGLLEDVSEEGPTLLAANRHLAAILKKKGYRVTYEEVGGTHEPVHWCDTLPQGLIALAQRP